MKYYHLSYNNHTSSRILLRKLLLLGALIADFIAICTIVQILVEGNIFVLQFFAIVALSTAVRVASMHLLRNYDYYFRDGELILSISNSISTKRITLLTAQTEYSITRVKSQIVSSNAIICCHTNDAPKYELVVDGKVYILALDDYMLALILSLNPKNEILS